MKTLVTLLFVASFACPVFGKPGSNFPATAEIPSLKYVSDPKAFLPEGSDKLTPLQQRALRYAKAVLSLYIEAEIRGAFSIAEADWGYQIDFTKIEIKKNGKWTEKGEGFGEVFLSKGLNRVQIDYGP